MALIKNIPPEYFEKTLELLDQHFRDENYSEKAVYYDLAARCVDIVWQYSTATKDSLLLAAARVDEAQLAKQEATHDRN